MSVDVEFMENTRSPFGTNKTYNLDIFLTLLAIPSKQIESDITSWIDKPK